MKNTAATPMNGMQKILLVFVIILGIIVIANRGYAFGQWLFGVTH